MTKECRSRIDDVIWTSGARNCIDAISARNYPSIRKSAKEAEDETFLPTRGRDAATSFAIGLGLLGEGILRQFPDLSGEQCRWVDFRSAGPLFQARVCQ